MKFHFRTLDGSQMLPKFGVTRRQPMWVSWYMRRIYTRIICLCDWKALYSLVWRNKNLLRCILVISEAKSIRFRKSIRVQIKETQLGFGTESELKYHILFRWYISCFGFLSLELTTYSQTETITRSTRKSWIKMERKTFQKILDIFFKDLRLERFFNSKSESTEFSWLFRGFHIVLVYH